MKKALFLLSASLLLAGTLAASALATDVNQAISEGAIEEVYGEYDGLDGSLGGDDGIEEVDAYIAGENVMEGTREVPVLD